MLGGSRNILTVIRSRMNFSQDFCPFIAHKLPFSVLGSVCLADTFSGYLVLLLRGLSSVCNRKFIKMPFNPTKVYLALFVLFLLNSSFLQLWVVNRFCPLHLQDPLGWICMLQRFIHQHVHSSGRHALLSHIHTDDMQITCSAARNVIQALFSESVYLAGWLDIGQLPNFSKIESR